MGHVKSACQESLGSLHKIRDVAGFAARPYIKASDPKTHVNIPQQQRSRNVPIYSSPRERKHIFYILEGKDSEARVSGPP